MSRRTNILLGCILCVAGIALGATVMSLRLHPTPDEPMPDYLVRMVHAMNAVGYGLYLAVAMVVVGVIGLIFGLSPHRKI